MPNHVRNKLEFSGKQEDIANLLLHVRSKDSDFDFNTLIPMPKTLDIESGSRTCLSLEVAEFLATGVITRTGDWLRDWRQHEAQSLTLEQYVDVLVKNRRCDLNLGEVARDNIRDHGHPTWYEWRCANWETKWDAYDVDVGEDTVAFSTAWSAPWPVIDKLAELFPAVHITHYWADESVGDNCGHTVYHDGQKMVKHIAEQSSEACEIYALCWGESECLERDVLGNLSRKECELCAGCD